LTNQICAVELSLRQNSQKGSSHSLIPVLSPCSDHCFRSQRTLSPQQHMEDDEDDVFSYDEDEFEQYDAEDDDEHNSQHQAHMRPQPQTIADQWTDEDPIPSRPASASTVRTQSTRAAFMAEAHTATKPRGAANGSIASSSAPPASATSSKRPNIGLPDASSILSDDRLERLKTSAYRRAHDVPTVDRVRPTGNGVNPSAPITSRPVRPRISDTATKPSTAATTAVASQPKVHPDVNATAPISRTTRSAT
jgi:hypothetical protein